MTTVHPWAFLFLSTGLLVLLFETLGRQSPVARALAALFCIGITIRYACWRVLFSMPVDQSWPQHIWAYFFLFIEMSTLLSSMLVNAFMSRSISRTPEADATCDSPLHAAPTDVFIASYNESYDILERTMVGALALDHPDLRVWILDDGNRAWVRELAESLGVHYVARIKGKHAKAGNVNNGARIAFATGRRPEFFLLLDADFIPHTHMLRRVLGLFEDPTIGIVQTPQHFFNPDPIQSNLVCTTVWPDEQRFFFNVLLPCKDAWGAAFCCGTSAIFRVAAFEAAGGMATETVTEDMLTSFKLDVVGYRTIFLNERLSLGLAPESLVEFIAQRSRWCLGAIQQIFTPWSFFGRARMSWINRIAFFDSALFWCSGAAFKIMLVSAPMVYWFTGTAVLHASGSDLIYWMAPMVVANLTFMNYLSGNRILPFMTDITQLLTAFVICRTVLTGLIRPFGRPFKVTAKGLSTTSTTVQWSILWPYALMGALTALGVLLHIAHFSPAHGVQGYSTNVFWSLVNAAMLTLAAIACIEQPHRRRDERFTTDEPALVRMTRDFTDEPPAFGTGTHERRGSRQHAGAARAYERRAGSSHSVSEQPPGESESIEIPCTLCDISLGGAALVAASGWQQLSGPAELILRTDCGTREIALPFTVLSRRGGQLTLNFHPDPWIRQALIRKLFTGAYHKDVETVNAPAVLTSLAQALFS